MCYNIIQYHDYNCGHYALVKQQMVDCNNRHCRFSSMHAREEHDCPSTCKQAMLPDQRIITDTRNAQCPSCAGTTNGH